MDELASIERPNRYARPLALFLGALLVANSLALLVAGPSRPVAEDRAFPARAGLSVPDPDDARRAGAIDAFRRGGVFVAFNSMAIFGLGFAVVARRLEIQRRRRLRLPDWVDEADLTPQLAGRGHRPPAASEYRPSAN